MLAVQLNAQLTFYVKPIVDIKASVSSSKPFGFSDYAINPSSYYFYDNKAIYLTPGFSFGFNLGLKSKNKKFTLELGFLDDATQSGHVVNLISTNNGVNYYDGSFTYTDGRRFQKFILQTTVKLKTFRNNSSISAVFGYSYSYRKANQIGLISYNESNTYTVDYNATMTYKSGLVVYRLDNHFLNLGISSEIYSKTKYLFDISFFYDDGFDEMSSVYGDITINENNASKKITYYSVSCGSGFHLQLSRKLQVHPWVKHKKRVQ